MKTRHTSLLMLLAFFFSNYSIAQTSKKEINSFYQQIAKLDTAEIKKGKHLELAKIFSIDEFVEYYVENGKEMDTKKYRLLTITELYNDSIFTYFGRKYSYGLIDFFKTANIELTGINYHDLDGNLLRANFIKEVVPEADKQKVEKKEKDCTTENAFSDFDYKYNRETKELEVTYKWKIGCDFLYKIINKVYTAKYNLNSKEFSK